MNYVPLLGEAVPVRILGLYGPVVKNLLANAGDTGSIPGLARFHLLQGN